MRRCEGKSQPRLQNAGRPFDASLPCQDAWSPTLFAIKLRKGWGTQPDRMREKARMRASIWASEFLFVLRGHGVQRRGDQQMGTA
jgi:hypothetical protein